MRHACHLCYLVFQGDLLAPFRACFHGATVSKTSVVPKIYLFFVCYGGHSGKSDEACYLLFTYMIPGKQFVYAEEGLKDNTCFCMTKPF